MAGAGTLVVFAALLGGASCGSMDGEGGWQGGRWAGRWVVMPPGVAFAPWTTVRSANGTLYAAEGAFRDSTGSDAVNGADTRAAETAFVDANLRPGPPPEQFPDVWTPLDASSPPFRARDADVLEDAMPIRPLAAPLTEPRPR